MNALMVWVYRSPGLGDCTNGGISARHDRLLLQCPDGPEEVAPGDERLLCLVDRGGHLHAEPVTRPQGRMAGPMFGGNYISTSDSRFGAPYPIPVHDRWGTWEMYDLLSR